MGVYEVVDTTDDEQYYTLGIFDTYQATLSAIEACGTNRVSGWSDSFDDEYEKIEIYKREFGWTERGKLVCTIERRLISIDDEYNETFETYNIKQY